MEGLGINLPILLAQVVNFLVLMGLLYLVAYKPLMRMLDERSGKVKESLEQAEQMKAEAERANEEIQRRLQEASRQGQEVIAQAAKIGEQLKEKAREEAKREAEKLLSRARAEIERERDEALSRLKEEFANLTIMAAEKVIDRSLDKEAHRQIIDQVLKESKSLKKG